MLCNLSKHNTTYTIQIQTLIDRGLNLFGMIRQFADEYAHSYEVPKTIRSQMMKNEPLTDYTIYYDPTTRAFGFTTGTSAPSSDNV